MRRGQAREARILGAVAIFAAIVTSGRVAEAEVGVWSLEAPATPVPDFLGFSLTNDSSRHRIVLFGGFFTDPSSATWEWDGATWTQACAAATCSKVTPPARSFHAAAFDSLRHKTVVFGGCVGETCPAPYLGDTWEWDGARWTEACASAACRANAPSARAATAMVFDSVRGRVVLFGGVSAPEVALGTWEWDGTAWSNACTGACSAPPPRVYHAMAFDAKRGMTLVHGGIHAVSSTASAALGDLWAWDGRAWTELCTSSSCRSQTPGLRDQETLTFDAARGVALAWGGCTNDASSCTSPPPNMWSWNGAVWAEEPLASGQPSLTPTPSNGQAMTYDDARERVVLVTLGPDVGVPIGATYEYHARGEICTSASSCDTQVCSNGACCEAACTDPCDVCDSPENPGICTTRKGCVASCDGDHTVTSSDGQSTIDCSPYECNPGGTCKTSCTTPTDCASPNVCNAADRCVGPTGGGGDDTQGGCTVASGSREEPFLAIAGLFLVMRRRRRSRP
jgi:hypothetical protein